MKRDDGAAARGLSIQRALVLLTEMEARLNAAEERRHEPIAIVGMGCRFPGGADDPDTYFKLLCAGFDAITVVPKDRWDVDAYYNPDPAAPGRLGTRWGGFLSQVDRFDAAFFNVSPREASCMDPQQRLVLEVAWEALESAGLTETALAKSATGVYLGICGSDYSRARFTDEATIDAYTSTGNALSIAASRIAYHLDLRGPAIAVDTACSSSLVAIHLACQSLRLGDCRQALAGGVYLMLSPETIISFTKWGMLSPDGRCKTFDSRANGIVMGEGCGVVVLKRLSDAIADGDSIVALIRGSAINQDGRSAGITAPNPAAQRDVVQMALAGARLSPSDVGYVEAHGTGTSLGDPIELLSLSTIYGSARAPGAPCFVGSMKTNMGHLEAAAGVAGLIKAALALRNRVIPPHLHFTSLNPNVTLEPGTIEIPTELTPWTTGASGPRRAAVSSFGFSGTNAHIILEEAAERAGAAPHVDDGAPYLVPLSARSSSALVASARSLCDALSGAPPGSLSLRDVSFSAGVRRTHFEHRLAIVGSSTSAIVEALQAFLVGETRSGMSSSTGAVPKRRRVAFVFSGHGSQWPRMGLDLAEREPVFRDALSACDEALAPFWGGSILRAIEESEQASRLERVDVAQPAIFAIQVALAALIRSYGVEPDVALGHSMGEIAAAHVAGALSLEDASRIICRRSQLMRAVSGEGGMILWEGSMAQAKEVEERYHGRVCVGAVNGPSTLALSGSREALAEIVADCERRGSFARWVKTDVAFHSAQMDPLADDLGALVRETSPKRGVIPLVSTVTGKAARGEELTADYWVRNLREPVAFWPAIRGLAEDGYDLFLEIAPHPVVTASIAQGLKQIRSRGVAVPTLLRGQAKAATLASLAALYCCGLSIDFGKAHVAGARAVSLPKYAWQRERFWIARTDASERRATAGGKKGHPLIHRSLTCASVPGMRLFEGAFDPERAPLLKQHCIGDKPVLPLAVILEVLLSAGSQILGSTKLDVSGFDVDRAVPLDGGARAFQLAATFEPDGAIRAQIHVADAAGDDPLWLPCARATVRRTQAGDEASLARSLDVARSRGGERVGAEDYYDEVSERGITLGPMFQGIEHVERAEGEALARVRAHDTMLLDSSAFVVHPAYLDACLQSMGAALSSPNSPFGREGAFVPFHIDRLLILGDLRGAAWSYAKLRAPGADGSSLCVGNITVADEGGRALAVIEGLVARRIARTVERSDAESGAQFYEAVFRPAALSSAPHRAPGDAHAPGAWLLLCDRSAVVDALVERRARSGERCVVARASEAFRHVQGDVYEVNMEDPADMRRLLDEAFRGGRAPCRHIVHLISLDAPPLDGSPSSLSGAWGPLCLSALSLAQALSAAVFRDAPRLWLVTRSAQSVGPSPEDVSAIQTMMWGLGRTITHERAELRPSLIDLGAGSEAESAAELIAEIEADGQEAQVALRGGKRYVARLVRAEAEPPAQAPIGAVRGDATYLITGGLGGVGLALARWLTQNGARSLILVGRSSPSEEAERALAELSAMGARVVVERADVSRESGARAALEAAQRADMPPIRGIVHAAGVIADATLLRLDRPKMEAVMAPKVDGALQLHRLTSAMDLDFFVLCSSIASLLGSPGQANYAAANAFLDGLAVHRRSLGLPAISIHWGGFADVGMAHRGGQGARLAVRGMKSFRAVEGAQAFGRLLGHGAPCVAFMAFDLRRWRQFYPTIANAPFVSLLNDELSEGGGALGAAAELRRALDRAASDEERRRLLGDHIRASFASVLETSPSRLSPEVELASLMLDSLMALELRSRIETLLGVTLSAAFVFTHRTLGSLTDDLAQRLGIAEAKIDDDKAGRGGAVDESAADLERSIDEIDKLSDEEVRALLEGDGGGR